MPTNEHLQADFDQALGEEFGYAVSPPVPFDMANGQECCEAVWLVLGRDVTPSRLATLTAAQLADLAAGFGRYFDREPPTAEAVRDAVAGTLARWPPVMLGEA